MLNASAPYWFLSWMLLIGISCPVPAQISQVNTFDLSPIPEHMQKVKPYRGVRWNRGTIRLNSGLQITGYLCYEPKIEALVSYQNKRIQIFRPYQLQGFVFFDQELQLLRQYQSITNSQSKGTKRYQIYEVVTLGNFSLLRKDPKGNAVYHKRSQPMAWNLRFDYFIWDGQTVWPYQQFQKQLLPFLVSKDPAFEALVVKRESPTLTVVERRKMIRDLNRISVRSG